MGRLRVVGPDERTGEKAGSLQVVLDDLAVASGHLTECRAEARECPGDVTDLDACLVLALDAVADAIQQVHILRGHA